MNLDECKVQLEYEKIIPRTSHMTINDYNNTIFNLLLYFIANYEATIEETQQDYYDGYYALNYIHDVYIHSRKILYMIKERNKLLSQYINIIKNSYKKYKQKVIINSLEKNINIDTIGIVLQFTNDINKTIN